MSGYVEFQCTCGRTLRVPQDKAGSRVCCWSCHAELDVPYPDMGERLTRESLDYARGVFRAEPFFFALLCGSLMSIILVLPWAGPVLAMGLLAVAGLQYREVVRQTGLHGTPDPGAPAGLSRRVVWRAAGALVASVGLIAPFLLRHVLMDGAGVLRSLGGAGVAAVALICWVVVPLAVLATSACDRAGPLSTREALAGALRHPFYLGATLLVLPATVLMVEAALVALTWEQGWFGFLVWDLFPPPRKYRMGLGRGYTLFGSLVASLPSGTQTRLSLSSGLAAPWQYLAVRMIFSALGLAAVGSGLALQARWLGLLPSLDARRRTRGGAVTAPTVLEGQVQGA